MAFSYNRPYLPAIDQLRAFAAMLVLFYHGLLLLTPQINSGVGYDINRPWQYPSSSNPLLTLIEEGHTGVSLFIVLSGFILSLGTIDNAVSYRRFLIARILRIYPLLIVMLTVAAYLGGGSLISFATALLPLNMASGLSSSFAAMNWAVAIEFQCYLVFPFLIAFSNERGSRFLLQVIAVALILRLLAVIAEGASPRDLSYWTIVGRIDQFCIGIIAARLYVADTWMRRLQPAWFLLSAAVAVLALWQFNRMGGWPSNGILRVTWPMIEGAIWAAFILTYLPASRLLPQTIGWLGAKLGEISYSIYMIHFITILAVIKLKWYVRPIGSAYFDALVTTLLVVLPLVVLIALLTYNTIELPFLRMRPKYIEHRS